MMVILIARFQTRLWFVYTQRNIHPGRINLTENPQNIRLDRIVWSDWRNLFALALPILVFFFRGPAEVVIALLVVAFVVRSFRHNDWGWTKMSWVIIGLMLWLWLLLVATPMAHYPDESWQRSLLFLRWIIFAAALAYWVLASTQARQIFQHTIMLLVLFVILDSVLQYLTGTDIFGYEKFEGVRLTGPFSDPKPGTYVLRVVFIAIAGLYWVRLVSFSGNIRNRHTAWLILLAFVAVAFVFLTGERIAFVMMVFSSMVMALTLFLVYPSQRKMLIVAAGLAVLAIVVLVITQADMLQRTIVSFGSAMSDYSNSPSGQLLDTSLALWRENVWTGVGPKNFRILCALPENQDIVRLCGLHSHNFYLEWLTEAGIPALLGFIVFVMAVFLRVWNIRFKDSGALIAVLTILVLATSFWPIQGSMSFFSNGPAMLVWMTVGWALSEKSVLKSQQEKK